MERVRRARLIPRWFIIALAFVLALPGLTLLVNFPLAEVIIKLLRTEAGVEVSSFRIRLLPRLTVEISDIMIRKDQHSGACHRRLDEWAVG